MVRAQTRREAMPIAYGKQCHRRSGGRVWREQLTHNPEVSRDAGTEAQQDQRKPPSHSRSRSSDLHGLTGSDVEGLSPEGACLALFCQPHIRINQTSWQGTGGVDNSDMPSSKSTQTSRTQRVSSGRLFCCLVVVPKSAYYV